MIENALAPKHQKISSSDHAALVDLLVSKDEELKKLLSLAAEQEKIEETMNELRSKVDVQVRKMYQYVYILAILLQKTFS